MFCPAAASFLSALLAMMGVNANQADRFRDSAKSGRALSHECHGKAAVGTGAR
jgi:hypothetical protein